MRLRGQDGRKYSKDSQWGRILCVLCGATWSLLCSWRCRSLLVSRAAADFIQTHYGETDYDMARA
jgi:hypothetical protein